MTGQPDGSGAEAGGAEEGSSAVERSHSRRAGRESAADRLVRYGWSLLLMAASAGGWIVDHCRSSDPAGAVIQAIRLFRGANPGRAAGEASPEGATQETQETRGD